MDTTWMTYSELHQEPSDVAKRTVPFMKQIMNLWEVYLGC